MVLAVAWMYVVLMVAVVEATSSQGSVLGALITLLLYGVLPLATVGYLWLSPARRRVRQRQESAVEANAPSDNMVSGSSASEDRDV